MKEIKRYECEVCGTDYNAPDEAQKCEGSHPKVKEGGGEWKREKEKD